MVVIITELLSVINSLLLEVSNYLIFEEVKTKSAPQYGALRDFIDSTLMNARAVIPDFVDRYELYSIIFQVRIIDGRCHNTSYADDNDKTALEDALEVLDNLLQCLNTQIEMPRNLEKIADAVKLQSVVVQMQAGQWQTAEDVANRVYRNTTLPKMVKRLLKTKDCTDKLLLQYDYDEFLDKMIYFLTQINTQLPVPNVVQLAEKLVQDKDAGENSNNSRTSENKQVFRQSVLDVCARRLGIKLSSIDDEQDTSANSSTLGSEETDLSRQDDDDSIELTHNNDKQSVSHNRQKEKPKQTQSLLGDNWLNDSSMDDDESVRSNIIKKTTDDHRMSHSIPQQDNESVGSTQGNEKVESVGSTQGNEKVESGNKSRVEPQHGHANVNEPSHKSPFSTPQILNESQQASSPKNSLPSSKHSKNRSSNSGNQPQNQSSYGSIPQRSNSAQQSRARKKLPFRDSIGDNQSLNNSSGSDDDLFDSLDELPAKVAKKPRRPWSLEEENVLADAVRKHGVGNWKDILRDKTFTFCQRTGMNLKDKWRNMNK